MLPAVCQIRVDKISGRKEGFFSKIHFEFANSRSEIIYNPTSNLPERRLNSRAKLHNLGKYVY